MDTHSRCPKSVVFSLLLLVVLSSSSSNSCFVEAFSIQSLTRTTSCLSSKTKTTSNTLLSESSLSLHKKRKNKKTSRSSSLTTTTLWGQLSSSEFSSLAASIAKTRLQVSTTREQEARGTVAAATSAAASSSSSSSAVQQQTAAATSSSSSVQQQQQQQQQAQQQQQWRENQAELQQANSIVGQLQQQQKQLNNNGNHKDDNNNNDDNDDPNMPVLGDDGVYHLSNPEQHEALLKKFPDQLIIMKVFAPWCRACKGLAPKFLQLVHDDKYTKFPIVWAELSIQHNKAFIKRLGVLALPTIQFYIAGGLSETFACGPSKVPMLKRKLANLINENVDGKTYQLKASAMQMAAAATLQRQKEEEKEGELVEENTIELAVRNQTTTAISNSTITTTTTTKSSSATATTTTTTTPQTVTAAPANATTAATASSGTASTTEKVIATGIPKQDRQLFAGSVPYFKQLSLSDLDAVMDRAKQVVLEPNTIIMNEGELGRTFYILDSGEVEVYQRTGFTMFDPLVARKSLGTHILTLSQKGDYFGERSLLTGEPRVSSIRASDSKPITVWEFDIDDFPESTVLSGRSKGTEAYDEYLFRANNKYQVDTEKLQDLYLQTLTKQTKNSTLANQVRGSVATPEIIRGVDTDDDTFVMEETSTAAGGVTESNAPPAETAFVPELAVEDRIIFSVLNRFQMIRHVGRCFHYMESTKVLWGDAGIRRRRNILVTRLTPAQRQEFEDSFRLLDADKDGTISLYELKRVMEGIGETSSEDNIAELFEQEGYGGMGTDRAAMMNLEDFMGIMAEAEFYHLFLDIFSSLDPNDSGFLRAKDLDRVLYGVRNLVDGGLDIPSLLDIEDKDMLIDYEQFARTLVGTTLL